MTKAQIARIIIEYKKDGGGVFVATSRDVPGLLLAHRNREAVIGDIPAAIKLLFKLNRGEDVNVFPAEDKTADFEPWIVVPNHLISVAA